MYVQVANYRCSESSQLIGSDTISEERANGYQCTDEPHWLNAFLAGGLELFFKLVTK